MDNIPYISLELLLEGKGKCSVRKCNIKLEDREADLFISGAQSITFRGGKYRRDDYPGRDIAKMDDNGIPYRQISYIYTGKE